MIGATDIDAGDAPFEYGFSNPPMGISTYPLCKWFGI
jgi:hypothetical protein